MRDPAIPGNVYFTKSLLMQPLLVEGTLGTKRGMQAGQESVIGLLYLGTCPETDLLKPQGVLNSIDWFYYPSSPGTATPTAPPSEPALVYSFDDYQIGRALAGKSSLAQRLIPRPPGLDATAWYDHARLVCTTLTGAAS